MAERFGATEEEWSALDLVHGFTADLLPVVSNPHAAVASNSTLKAIGKVPSVYNRERKIVGIADWTSRQSSRADIEKWIKEKDYGICLQTRVVRALDIDTENSAVILNYLWEMGFRFPMRTRSNSGKCLLAFTLPGELSKRVIKTSDGIIEFLATGQQFIAHGTHTSGVKYEWDKELDFPELSLGEFESLWLALENRFATEPSTTGAGVRKKGPDLAIEDAIAPKLKVLARGKKGEYFITCPFIDGHSMQSGSTETAYFAAGTNGYEQGHFRCQHASCAGYSDSDFIKALGLYDDMFDVVEVPEDEPALLPRLSFKRTPGGEIKATLDNVCMVLERPDISGWQLAHDSFCEEDMKQPFNGAMEWEPITDNDYAVLQRHMERKLKFPAIHLQILTRAVAHVAFNNTFDSAKLWLNSLEWDGVPRLNNFLRDALGCPDTEYSVAVSRYIWSAMCGRIVEPGVKADMMLILQGEEGLQKSTIISELVPSDKFFAVLKFDDDEKDLARKMRGKLVAEVAELRGLNTKDMESIKEFIVRQNEEWIPKFKEKRVTFARRLILFGTTNDESFLTEEGKKRRFLPAQCGKVNLKYFKENRLQYWAEGRELFKQTGVCWQDAERLAPAEHTKFISTDLWSNYISDWLSTPDVMDDITPCSREYIRSIDIMRGALSIDAKNVKGHEGKRIGRIMKARGFEHIRKRVNGTPEWVWLSPSGSDLV